MRTALVAALAVTAISMVALANAGEELVANELTALRSALRARAIAAPSDFVRMIPKGRDATIVSEYVKSRNANDFAKPSITMPAATVVRYEVAGLSADVDYREIHEGRLYCNGQLVTLASSKTVLNYKNEISAILSRTEKTASFSFSVIPSASATSLKDRVRDWLAFHISMEAVYPLSNITSLRDVRTGNLERELIRTYEAELDGWAELDLEGAHLSVLIPVFACNTRTKKLESVTTQDLRTDGKTIRREDSRERLVRTEGGYAIHEAGIRLDEKFRVKPPGDRDLPAGTNYLVKPPYMQFPGIAARCCEKPGCYQKVLPAFTKALKKAGLKHRQRRSAQ